MFRHCVFCHARLPSNETVERFPVGRRIAFDPQRGRLWAVCPACRRWNLAPFEDRWEALEELERRRVDRGRVLASTDNIALIEASGIELVRVGRARLPEEAWWRYGQQMRARRARSRTLRWLGDGVLVGAAVASGGFVWLVGMDWLNQVTRWNKFGRVAWRGESACVACGRVIDHLTFRHAGRLHLSRDLEGDTALHLQCARCRFRNRSGEHRLEGVVAGHVLRRVMAYHLHSGASENRVRAATDYIDRMGSPAAVLQDLSKTGLRVDRLVDRDRRTQGVALEIALNEETERRMLEMEVAELESRWRDEEEIAAIADGLLTPVPGLDRLRGGGAGV